MHPSYTLRQEPDRSWTVLTTLGVPLKLAGIPQTGLTQVEAEITIELLMPKAPSPEKARPKWAALASPKVSAA